MKPLPIAAAGSYAELAGPLPADLRTPLRAVCPNAPRRVNRLIQLALIGAHRCVAGRVLPSDTPIYMAFTNGCIADSVESVAQVVQGRPPMPVAFINISSNMAGFYVAGSLGLHSGNQVIASRDFAWEAALEMAMLGSAHCRGLLVGSAEECAWPLEAHRERIGVGPGTPLLEASHWLLADRTLDNPPAVIHWVRRFASLDEARQQLRAEALPAPARLAVGSTLEAEAAALAASLDRPLWRPVAAGFSGLQSAAVCCEFIGRERGALLYLNRGADGACYALLISTN
jgi:hypothetical protein